MLYADKPSYEKPKEKLEKLVRTNSHVIAASIMSIEGLPITSVFPQNVNDLKVSAMAATLYSISKRAIEDMKLGDFDQLSIQGTDGSLLISQGGPNEALLVSLTKDAKLGLIIYDCEKICEEIGNINIISVKVIRDILSIMKKNNINILTLKRSHLSKFFNDKLLDTNSKQFLPFLRSQVISQFERYGIEVKHDDKIVKFINKINKE